MWNCWKGTARSKASNLTAIFYNFHQSAFISFLLFITILSLAVSQQQQQDFDSSSTTEESYLVLGRDSHRVYTSNNSRSRTAAAAGSNNNNNENLTNLTHEVLEATLYSRNNNNSSPNSRADSGRSLDSMTNLFSRFSKALDLGKVVREIETSVMSSVSCTACRAGVGLLLHYVHSGRTNQEIASAATKLCINLKMQSPRVCTGIIHMYIDEAVEVLRQVVLDSNDICASVVGEACGSGTISPQLEWSVQFPPIAKPPVVVNPSEPKKGAPVMKVLQISDTHWDPWYEAGANADCNEPLCCRLSSGPPPPPQTRKGAGVWGDYRKCDTPRVTIESMLAHIRDTHTDIDYIIWTGDIPAHDVWNQTHEENINIIRDTVDLFLQYFPHTPIFPALGNHESVPVNSFAPSWVKNSEFSIDWLYAVLQEEWAKFLPATTQRTIGHGAYYSTILKPGFKMISLNMNYCNNKNWWLLINGTDPTDELKWLIFELQSSELAEEKVHIIGHIPPGHSDCLATWSKNYYKIISRYESTIVAQFFGHTHFDELELFYSLEDPWRPSSIAYIAPSVTPYYDVNPGYRIYTIDGDYPKSSRAVLDHETWVADLGEANRMRASSLDWYKLYSAKEAYLLKDLSPSSWEDLVMNMYKNRKLFNLYYRFYNKNSPVAPPCDDDCMTRLLCDMRSGRSHAREQLCKPRPPNTRTFRDSMTSASGNNFERPAVSHPPSTMARVFGYISSAFGKRVEYKNDGNVGTNALDDNHGGESTITTNDIDQFILLH